MWQACSTVWGAGDILLLGQEGAMGLFTQNTTLMEWQILRNAIIKIKKSYFGSLSDIQLNPQKMIYSLN